MARSAPSLQLPTYRLHRTSGQARVRLNGRDHYLGAFDAPQSRQRYDELLQRWLAHGRRLPEDDAPPEGGCFIPELIAAFMDHAQQHYRKNDRPTGEVHCYRACLRLLRAMYGDMKVEDFRPRHLRTLRERYIDEGLARKTINGYIKRVRHVFKWGVGHELVPPQVLQALDAVEGLQKGRSRAHETDPVRPACDADVDATLTHLSRPVRAIIELLRLTGARVSEICLLRLRDVDMRDNECWTYTVPAHKTDRYGRPRVIHLGRKAQAITAGFLTADPDRCLFQPAEAAIAHYKGRLPQGRPYNPHYNANTLRVAVHRACIRAQIEPWNPGQLRHSYASRVRAQFGAEAAQVLLGHSSLTTTEIYAERDQVRGRSIAAAIG